MKGIWDRVSAVLDLYMQQILFLPAAIIIFGVFIYPLIHALYMSLHDWSFFTLPHPPFVGLTNYVRLLSDSSFYQSLGRTVLFVTVAVGLQLVFGIGLALLVDALPKGRGLFTTLFIFPMMVTPVVVGLIWKFILDFNFGIFNYFLTVLGLERLAVLSSRSLAMPAVILIDTWQWTSFMFIVLLAGLRSLPAEPFEAAELDGVNWWTRLRHITIPLLRPVIVVSLIMRISGAVKTFDNIFVLTGGGPGTATEVVSLFLYRKAFVLFEMSYAAAGTILIAATVAFLCYFAIRALYAET